MKYHGQDLIETLRTQGPAVTLIDEDGRPHTGLSPRYVAELIQGRDFTGFGKHGYIERVRPSLLKLGPFASKPELQRTMKSFPRLPIVQKNAQSGRATWAPQPANAHTGTFGTQRTLFFKP